MYEFEVFVSYKRGGFRDEWMNELFMPWFSEQLDGACANYGLETPRIFYDRSSIQAAQEWTFALRNGIARSKLMLCILTPTYFRRSEWCLREFAAMYYRSKQLGFLSSKNNDSLILPVMQQTVRHLPQLIERIQFLDYTKFNQVGPAFKESTEYLEFQDTIIAHSDRIAKLLFEKTPQWTADFESEEWIEKSFDSMLQELNIQEPKQTKPGWEK